MSDPVTAPKVGVDRAALFERFQEANNAPIVGSEDVPADTSASSDNASPSSESAPRPEGEESVETPVEAPAKVEKSDQTPAGKSVEKKDEEKLVSKKALDEEREKRKAKTLEARNAIAERDAERQSRLQLEARVKELENKLATPAKPGAPAQKEDEVARQLAEENRKLKDENQKAAEKARADETAKVNAEMQALVAKTGKSLAAEGFPGFTHFTVDVANAISARINAGEMEVADVTPELWAKVYKEDIYPEKKAIFAAQQKKEKADQRTSAKRDASLVRTPGAAPQAAEEPDLDQPQTAESYMKFRKTLK